MNAPLHPEPLYFLPLGGAGEIGMNLNLYGLGGKWLMVDCGVTFADPGSPGFDLIAPDATWIESRSEDLLAIVATHAHEDHIGAIPHLWSRLRCPIYATGFTASLIRGKLVDAGLLDEVEIREMRPGERFEIGPFAVTAIGITHSIPESHALAIETPHGVIVHSGDWKLDPEPLVGPATDVAALAGIGDRGALALVCDSTNVFSPGASGSESEVRKSLLELLKHRDGRICVTTFASNVARVETLAKVAEALGRQAVLVGRSLHRTIGAARENGYLGDLRPFVDERECGYLPRDKTFLICTGCQGEPRGAMARIALDEHPNIALAPGDLAVFSSKIIPGNERSLYRVHNLLAAAGVDVITERDHFVHVSGHPSRDELAQMYAWVRPRIAIPVHGEARHIHEHVKLAKALQVPTAVAVRNGQMLRLAPGPVEAVEEVPHGRLAVDAGRLVPLDGGVVQERRRLMHNGAAQVALVVDRAGRLVQPPRVAFQGVLDDPNGTDAAEAVKAVADAVRRLPRAAARDDDAVREAARVAVRRHARSRADRRPVTEVFVMRLDEAGASPAGQEDAA